MGKQKRLFITGCAKSGTTLLQRCFYSFHNTYIIDKEVTLKGLVEFEGNDNGCEYIVAKRTRWSIFSCEVNALDFFLNQISAIHRFGIKVINIIRDGRDVIESGVVKPGRWIGAVDQYLMFRAFVDLCVKYEDLVENPDLVQQRIMTEFGLVPKASFSDYPDFVPQHVFEHEEYRKFSSYRPRKIDSTRVGKGFDYRGRCASGDELLAFEERLGLLGYADDKEATK